MSSVISIILDISRPWSYPDGMKKKDPQIQVQTFTVTRKVTLEDKACSQCGKHFVGRKNKQYCSMACARKASYWRNPDAYRESRMKSYHKHKEEKH